jgi:hypothetical protein
VILRTAAMGVLFGVLALLPLTASTGAITQMKDARKLALQASDLPSSARRMSEKSNRSALLPGGRRGHAYTTTFRFPSGLKREGVTVLVVATGSGATARAVHAQLVAEAKRAPGAVAVRLRTYGAGQYAWLSGRIGLDEAQADILVRQGAVVWGIGVSTDPSAKDFGFTRAEAVAELSKYASKQQRRVGGN